MLLFPAIDLYQGQVVRLRQGDFQKLTSYSPDPVQVARQWETAGAPWLHVVDLEGARAGRPENLTALEDILRAVKIPVQFGGGLRQKEDIRRVLDLGVKRVILGTRALHQDFLEQCLGAFGAGRLIVSLDLKGEEVATDGWQRGRAVPLADLVTSLQEAGLREVIVTDVRRDGTLSGPNLPLLERVLALGLLAIAAGGVATLEDLRRLKFLEGRGLTGVILGKALYDGNLQLEEALAVATAS